MKKKYLTGFILILGYLFVNSQEISKEKFDMADITKETNQTLPEIWSYTDCLNWAVSNNVDIKRAWLSILEADENIGMAKDQWLPYIGFSTSHNYVNFPNPNLGQTGNTYGSSYNINASWTIWEGNVRKYKLETSRLLKQQQQFAHEDIIKELQLGILQYYLNILYSAEAVEIAKRSLEVSTAQAERAKKLMENGRSSKVDYAQMESQRAQDEYYLVQAQSNYETSKANLKNLLNLGLDYDLKVEEITFPDEEINIVLPEKTNVFEIAMAWLPQFQSNQLNKEIFDYNIKIAKAGQLPNISLNGGIGTGYNSGGSSWGSQMGHGLNENIGLSLSVPIYDGNITRRAVAMAKLEALNYDLNELELRNQLSQVIENLYIESQNARAKYISGISQLESAELTARLVDRQFELGLVNPLDLLTAHNNLLNARLELLQSKYMAILSNKTITYYATTQILLP